VHGDVLAHSPLSPQPAESLRDDFVMDRRTFLAGAGAVHLAAPPAAALGLTIPPALLGRADEVIR
jgi:hypothetical protein